MMVTNSVTTPLLAPPIGTCTVPQRMVSPSTMPRAAKHGVGSSFELETAAEVEPLSAQPPRARTIARLSETNRTMSGSSKDDFAYGVY